MKKLLIKLTTGLLIGLCIVLVWQTQYQSKATAPQLHTTIQHLGVIMDGNRRWAQERGLQPWLGHRKGAEIVQETIKFCLDHRIPYLTLYAFSLENFKRSKEELQYLFDVLAQEFADKELDQLIKHGIRVRFMGDHRKFPEKLVPLIQHIEEKTAQCTTLYLNLLFCYGGQQEIFNAVQEIITRLKEGILQEHEVTPQLLEQFLWSNAIPAPELIIRTGGAQRLSNFLTYKAAYSELYFIKKYWPDITYEDLKQALYYFEQCKRNFGA